MANSGDFISGLLQGTDPFVKEYIKSSSEKKQRRQKLDETQALLEKLGLTAAVRDLSDPQATSEAVEREAATGRLGQSVDMQEQIGQRQQKANDLVGIMAKLGLNVKDGGMSMDVPSGSQMVPMYNFNPETGEYEQVGTTPKGSPVRNIRPSLERLEQESGAKATGTQNVKNKELVRQFGFISRDIDSILEPLSKIPAGRLEGPLAAGKAAIGIEGSENVFDYENSKEIILAKIAKAFGGEVGVLTDRDIDRIKKAFPPLWMNPRERASRIAWVRDYVKRRVDAYADSDDLPDVSVEDNFRKNLEYQGLKVIRKVN